MFEAGRRFSLDPMAFGWECAATQYPELGASTLSFFGATAG
jgi:hypothetical protein